MNCVRAPNQVFRRAVNVSSTLFQITAYELLSPESSADIAPTLKFIAYDPKKQTQVRNHLLEALPEEGAVFVYVNTATQESYSSNFEPTCLKKFPSHL